MPLALTQQAQSAIKIGAFQAALSIGLAPVAGRLTRVLVLGSFPSAASLAQQQYYAHPRNQFWPLLAALWPQHPLPAPHDYAGRCAWLLERGLGVWDVYAACERRGSLDSAIKRGELNPFAALARHCPQLTGFAHNGALSARHAAAVQAAWPRASGAGAGAHRSSHRLPSTSPAHAAMGFAAKCAAWRVVMAEHGLL